MGQEGIGTDRSGRDRTGSDWNGLERPFFKHPDAYLAMNFEHIGQARRGMERLFLKRNTWKRH
jgi:hypothetical protein